MTEEVKSVGGVINVVDAGFRHKDQPEQCPCARRCSAAVKEHFIELLSEWRDLADEAVPTIGGKNVAVGRNGETQRPIETAAHGNSVAGAVGSFATNSVVDSGDAIAERVCDVKSETVIVVPAVQAIVIVVRIRAKSNACGSDDERG